MIRFARRWMMVSLVFVVVVVARRAHAGDDLKAMLERAETSYALGEYAEAAREYELAFKAKPQSALLYNAAQSHRLAGNKERALQLYVNYIRVYGDRVSNRRDVEAMVEKLRNAQAVDHGAQTAPPTGTVPANGHVEAAPPGASSTAATVKPTTPAAVEPAPTTVEPAPPNVETASPAVEAPAPVAPARVEAPSPAATDLSRPAPTPIVRRPAFWGVLFAGVVVVAAGVSLTAVLAAPAKDPVGNLNPFVFGR